MIHPSAIVDPKADIGADVTIGPWSVVGAGVEIGAGTSIGSHVVIEGPATIGENNRIYSFNSIGGPPQDKKYAGEASRLEIGVGNVIREYCTINRGTALGGGVTILGDNNWIMAYVHLAHDCQVGNDVTMANGSTLAGHVCVDDGVTFGAFTIVHQFCRIGAFSFSAMGTVVFKDIPPYVTVSGNAARPHGLNSEGLRRRGMSHETIRGLKRAYKAIYKQGLTIEQAQETLAELSRDTPEIGRFSDFLQTSSRGIVR